MNWWSVDHGFDYENGCIAPSDDNTLLSKVKRCNRQSPPKVLVGLGGNNSTRAHGS